MAIDTNYALAMGNGLASVAPSGTPNPDNMVALSAPWVDLGSISTAGLTENLAETRTEFKRWGSITTFQAVITDQKHTFDVSFLESNPVALGVFYRVPTIVPTGTGVSEVQTITITGTPTGGAFTLVFNGSATTDIAYNATASTVQTALQALASVGAGNATVTGGPGPGTPYVVTFTGTLANTNVPQMTAVANFTGGTTPAIAVTTTTGGAVGQIMKITDDTTGQRDVRAWTFDILQGTNHIRFYVPAGEVTARKNPVYKTDSLIEYGVTITCYPTSSGVAIQRQMLLDAVVQGL
jgi:hypothetical protein